MSVDPFRITGPAVISFSGGRTSAYMLWRILQAHGARLPDDVLVCFANTGREMPATLDFVRDCGAAWSVHINWLEYRWVPGGQTALEVSHNSASREGEPFAALLAARSYLPNPVSRFCTQELKVRTITRYVRRELMWRRWLNVVGLRADEPSRVARLQERNAKRKDTFSTVCPLEKAGVDEAQVFAFWREQPFDLRLAGPWEGNCDGCFLKNRAGMERMLLDHPERMSWWAAQEAQSRGTAKGARFRKDREDVATMTRIVREQGRLPFDLDEVIIPCDEAGCGV